VGKQETIKMIDLLKNFSNFMMGSLALSIVLLGSIVYPMIVKPKEETKPKRRTPVRKTTTPRKPAVRKTTTPRKTVSK